MITEILLKGIFSLLRFVLRLLPELSVEMPDGIFESISNFIDGIGFFLPISLLLPLLYVYLSIVGFHVIWSLILVIKSFIPFLGS
jgi:hypothetical protein